MSGMFNKGFSAVREEKERQDQNRENAGKRLFRFFLPKDGDEATVRFLTEEPVTFYEHTLNKGGKYESVICTGAGCPLCADDRSSFKGAFLIYDKRPYKYTDRNNKEVVMEGQIRLYVAGTRVLSQLDRLSARYGLTGRDIIVSRSGSGTATTYMFERDREYRMSEEEIRNLLPEKLRPAYKGTAESLESIVQEQLEMLLDTPKSPSREEEDEEEASAPTNNPATLVNIEDEDEEPAPATAPARKLPPLGGLKRKPVENSKKSPKDMFKGQLF